MATKHVREVQPTEPHASLKQNYVAVFGDYLDADDGYFDKLSGPAPKRVRAETGVVQVDAPTVQDVAQLETTMGRRRAQLHSWLEKHTNMGLSIVSGKPIQAIMSDLSRLPDFKYVHGMDFEVFIIGMIWGFWTFATLNQNTRYTSGEQLCGKIGSAFLSMRKGWQ